MDLSISDYIAIGSISLNILVALVGGTWGISKITANISTEFQQELDGQKEDTTRRLDGLQRLMSGNELAMERNIGETGAAIREKIKEVELFTRDNFVRRDTFHEMVQLLTTNMQTQFGRLEETLNRLSDKLDRLVERAINSPP